MDCLMNGVGVGFSTHWRGVASPPNKDDFEVYVIPDSREGWVESLIKLMCAYIDSPKYGTNKYPKFDYSKIRLAGLPIKGFGGTSSGSGPLKKMHNRIEGYLDAFCKGKLETRAKVHKPDADGVWKEVEVDVKKPYGHTRLVADIFNAIGACVVAGNVRRCLPGDALVYAKEGLIPIQDIKVGTDVLTSSGYEKVSNKFEQGNQELVRIITQDGDFKCTKNHRMAVCIGYNSHVWKEAGKLVPGDRLITSRSVLCGTKTKLPFWEYVQKTSTCNNIIIPLLDSNMAWFIGLFQSRGYTYTNYDHEYSGFNAYVSIIIDADKKQDVVVVKAQEQLQRFGDSDVILKKCNNENSWMVHSQSKQLAWYFDKNIKYQKRVPKYIMNGLPEIRLAFVAGVCDGKGCLKNRPMNVLTTIYEEFARDIQQLLYSCGIESRFSTRADSWPSREGWQRLYMINLITLRSQSLFCEIPELHCKMMQSSNDQSANGFPCSFETTEKLKSKYGLYDNNQFNIDSYEREYVECEYTPVEVINVEKIEGMTQTYDIEVENKHEFFCNGYRTHNSAEIALGHVDDREFIDLKNYTKNPERGEIGWMSNNSIVLKADEDYENFSHIPDLAARVRDNGEPGMINLHNIQKFGRYGKEVRDNASLCNPCFSGETLIATADGRGCVRIDELVKEGKDVPVYSIDETSGEVSIQWGRHPRVTGRNKKLLRVHFGYYHKGEYLDVTPNHKFLLNDGRTVEAKDLKKGDSLPQFKSTVFNDDYRRVYTPSTKKYRVEHRMIKEFFEPEAFYKTYQDGVYNGCCKTHNVVVHHKDENKLNNHPENLDITTASEHNRIHNVEYIGEGNPMYGKKHTEATKKLIGEKCSLRCEDPEYRDMLSKSQTPQMRDDSSKRMKVSRAKWLTSYYDKVITENCGLRIVRESDTVLRVIRTCENDKCAQDFSVPWRHREYAFCSHSCSNTKKESIEARKKGQTKTFESKAKDNFYKQAMIYQGLLDNKSPVMKKDFEQACKSQGVSCRFNAKSSNPW
ncbi:MAG: hypothetical protein GY861_02620, partial [bacterium]|nr:hypothetical protein [bacterium]